MINPSVHIFADGSYSPKHDVGGWAFIVPAREVECTGAVRGTTNNRMELEAILQAMVYAVRNLKDDKVIIFSDSKYSVNALVYSSYNVTVNADLIAKAKSLAKAHGGITLFWVKGHSWNRWNSRADLLATNAKREVIGLAPATRSR